MKHHLITLTLGLLAVSLSVTLLLAAGAVFAANSPGARTIRTGLSPSGCIPAWEVVTTPNVETENNHLLAIDVVTSNDVWAVGTYSVSFYSYALIEHWDGISWS